MMPSQIDGIKRFTKQDSIEDKKNATPVVSFVSGKGGTGKSVLILSVAASLAGLGKRVLLIDGDTTFANLSILCNYAPTTTLADFFNSSANLSQVTRELSNLFHFLPGSSGYREYGDVTEYELRRLFLAVKELKEYDLVLIDTASGLHSQTLEILKHSDVAVLISGTEPTSLMDTYLVEKLIYQEKLQIKRVVLINKATTEKAGREAYENLNKPITHFLGNKIALLGVVGWSTEISESVMKQHIAYTESATDSSFRKRINEIAQELNELVLNIKDSI